MRETTLLRQLEALVQEELGAQSRAHALLEALETAILSGEPGAIEERSAALDSQVRSAADRSRRRADLLKAFAQHWQVADGSLTLGSIAERAGPAGLRLARQRADLRTATARVARRTRRIAAAASLHRRLTEDVIQRLLEAGHGAAGELTPDGAHGVHGGTLVNAEA